jgi:hypothetical protein
MAAAVCWGTVNVRQGTAENFDADDVAADRPAAGPIADVTSMRLVDVLHSSDPALRESIQALESLLSTTTRINPGWSSFIDTYTEALDLARDAAESSGQPG